MHGFPQASYVRGKRSHPSSIYKHDHKKDTQLTAQPQNALAKSAACGTVRHVPLLWRLLAVRFANTTLSSSTSHRASRSGGTGRTSTTLAPRPQHTLAALRRAASQDAIAFLALPEPIPSEAQDEKSPVVASLDKILQTGDVILSAICKEHIEQHHILNLLDWCFSRPCKALVSPQTPSRVNLCTVLVDDGDNRIQYSPGWSEDSGSGIVEVDSTRHEASQGGLTASLTFSGTRVSVVGTRDDSSSHGQPNTAYFINTVLQGTYSAPFTTLGDVFYNVTFFTSPTLPFGDHTVTITMEGGTGTGPQIFVLDYFLVDTGQPSLGPPAATLPPAAATPPPSATPDPPRSTTSPFLASSTFTSTSSHNSSPNGPSSAATATSSAIATSSALFSHSALSSDSTALPASQTPSVSGVIQNSQDLPTMASTSTAPEITTGSPIPISSTHTTHPSIVGRRNYVLKSIPSQDQLGPDQALPSSTHRDFSGATSCLINQWTVPLLTSESHTHLNRACESVMASDFLVLPSTTSSSNTIPARTARRLSQAPESEKTSMSSDPALDELVALASGVVRETSVASDVPRRSLVAPTGFSYSSEAPIHSSNSTPPNGLERTPSETQGHSRSQSILDALFPSRDSESPARRATDRLTRVFRDVDSGLREYDVIVLPPPYTRH
ncbi:hypothetical protein VTO73DRAFT_3583 [Trametes versicolor]